MMFCTEGNVKLKNCLPIRSIRLSMVFLYTSKFGVLSTYRITWEATENAKEQAEGLLGLARAYAESHLNNSHRCHLKCVLTEHL